MGKRTCKVCRERPAVFCASCGPHQSAPELVAMGGDREGLRSVEAQAQGMMRAIDSVLPPGWGAVLFFTQYGQGGYASYVSTLIRTELPTALREFATQIEERSDRAPGHLGVEN